MSAPGPDTALDADLNLVRRAQTGDTAAFGELVERNRKAVFRAAVAALGSTTDADDVAQEAFVMAYGSSPASAATRRFGPGCSRSRGARRSTAAKASGGGCD